MNPTSSIYKEMEHSEIINIIASATGEEKHIEYKLIPGGMFNTTYFVSYGEPQKKAVLRAGPVNRHLLPLFEQNLMEAEAYVYELCEKAGIPCSKVICCDCSKKLVDRDYMLVQYVDAVPMSNEAVDENQKPRLREYVGQYAKKLHAIMGDSFGRVSHLLAGRRFDTWYEYLHFELSDLLTRSFDIGIYTKSECDRFYALFESYRPLLCAITKPYLCHCDLWEGNVLVAQDNGKWEVVAIIDSDRATFADRDYDIASGWMTDESFFKGYGEVADTPDSAIRKKLYRITYALIDAYVLKAEYNRPEASDNNKNEALEILKEMELLPR